MRGWSTKSLPNAARCDVCHVACATAWRIPAAEPSTQSSRVWLTISMMVRTPLPSSPIIHASAASNSTSELAFDRFPSLSLRRWMWNALRVPSGRHRGSRKHDSPAGACASTRNASHIGAEQNHLWPVISNSPLPAGSALVVFARTSEPPCFSVMAIPHSAPSFCAAGMNRWSYTVDRNRGSHSAASSGFARSAGTPA